MNRRETKDLDVTGSPLKDDFSVDAIDNGTIDVKINIPTPWVIEEECHQGLSVEKARSIVCNLDLQEFNNSDSHGSVWILCNGVDDQKTIFFQIEFTENYFTRGTVTFNGIIKVDTINSQDLFQQHFKIMRKRSKTESTIDCFYNIKSNILLKSSWSTTSENPALTNLKNSDIMLYQTFWLNNCHCLTEELMIQLRRLLVIKNDIVSFQEKDDNSKEPVYRCGMLVFNAFQFCA